MWQEAPPTALGVGQPLAESAARPRPRRDHRAILQDAELPPESLDRRDHREPAAQGHRARTAGWAALRSVGVKVAVDDFGTGYSSFAYLDRYPVDILKIDRSFVVARRRPRAAALVRSILELASVFDLETVAEGIETTTSHVPCAPWAAASARASVRRPRPAEQITSMLTTDALAGMRDEPLDGHTDDRAGEHAAATG